MSRLLSRRKEPGASMPESRLAPEPEGPDEVYRRFERLNRGGQHGGDSGGPGGLLVERVKGVGKKSLYGGLAALEVAALVLGIFFQVPFMDVVALILPGILLALISGSNGEEAEEEQTRDPGEESFGPRDFAEDAEDAEDVEDEPRETPAPGADTRASRGGEPEEETFLETLLRRFGVEIPGDEPRSGGR